MAEHKQDRIEDDEVLLFLKHFGLEQYSKNMMDCGLNDLKDMSEDRLKGLAKKDLGIKKEYYVVKFLKACAALKNGEYIPATKDMYGVLAVAVTDGYGAVADASKVLIAIQSRLRHSIDMHATITKLATCGALLQNAARDGTNCDKNVVVLLGKYAKMVKDSCIASSYFVGSSLTALQYHKLALVFAEKGKAADSVTLLAKCAEVAKEMSKVAKGLTTSARILNYDAEKALSLRIDEKTRLQDEIKEINADMDGKGLILMQSRFRMQAKLDDLSASSDSLDKAIKTLKIAIQNCGQIANIFYSTREFWKEVEERCMLNAKEICPIGEEENNIIKSYS